MAGRLPCSTKTLKLLDNFIFDAWILKVANNESSVDKVGIWAWDKGVMMFDFILYILGTNIRVYIELKKDKEGLRAIFLITDGTTAYRTQELPLSLNRDVGLFTNYYFYPLELKKGYISFAIGIKNDSFAATTGDTNVLGYAETNFNDLIPEYLIFLDDEIKIKTGQMARLANTDFYLSYDKNKQLKLYYKNLLSRNLEPFNPKYSEGKFVVFDEVTRVSWHKGDVEEGIIFDATGSGTLQSAEDYPVYNDFYITDVGEDYVAIKPAMITKPIIGQVFKLKGQNYLPISIDLKDKNLMLNPVLVAGGRKSLYDYFDLNLRINPTEIEVEVSPDKEKEEEKPEADESKLVGRAATSEHGEIKKMSAFNQASMYFGIFIGVFFSSALSQLKQTGVFTISLDVGTFLITAVIAFVLVPIAYEKLSLNPETPLIVQFGLFVQYGVFWHVIIDSISSI